MSECNSKLWFPSKSLAKKKAKQAKNRLGFQMSVYRCKLCDGYHMTSKTAMGYKMKARGNAK